MARELGSNMAQRTYNFLLREASTFSEGRQRPSWERGAEKTRGGLRNKITQEQEGPCRRPRRLPSAKSATR